MYFLNSSKRLQKVFANPAWALIAAFGTYFCMYDYRKPYTAAAYADATYWGLSYKFGMIIAQTIGYVLAKWVGIKFVSEIHSVRILYILITSHHLSLYQKMSAPGSVLVIGGTGAQGMPVVKGAPPLPPSIPSH